MKVALFVTCLVDQIKPEVGEAAVRVLRRAGCDVTFDPRQTCCAQPAFNTGYREEAREVAREYLSIYDTEVDAIVMPSGSCAAMVHHYDDLFADEPETLARAHRVSKALRAGTVWVNNFDQADMTAPFGGTKQSGFGGKDKSKLAVDKYTNIKTTWINFGKGGR